MYGLEAMPLAPNDEREKYEDVEPQPREVFEAGLRTGRIEGLHYPETLADEPPFITAGGVRQRRHRLQYRWNPGLRVLGVISCNPSAATRRRLDDTLALTVNQATLWGFGGIDQGNLDPVYETNSRRVHVTGDFEDPVNRTTLAEIVQVNDDIWLAWGNRPAGFKGDQSARWTDAEQHVLAAGYREQARGTRFLVTNLNKPRPMRAPAHASPRRFPPSKPSTLYTRPLLVRIVRIG